jgi:glycosyltransferase involved in cell wall biosynthesis
MIEPQTDASIYDIDNPVDERFFKIVHRPELGRILYVGWINERKNTLGAVEAFANVASHYVEAKLIIAGEPKETEYFNRVKQSIEQHGIVEKVELSGHIDHAQLEWELARASVFLLPSRQENSPMAIAEAMAAGVPVIASNRCGMPYMVRDGESGFLVDPNNPHDISQRLGQLLKDDELRRSMGAKGREIALDRFHPAKVAVRTRDVYLRAIQDFRRKLIICS